jgi:hypothetical protein
MSPTQNEKERIIKIGNKINGKEIRKLIIDKKIDKESRLIGSTQTKVINITIFVKIKKQFIIFGTNN